MYVFTSMDWYWGGGWLGSRKSFSGQWLWSAYGHADGYWRGRSRRIRDERRGPWRLRWNDPHNPDGHGWRRNSDCDCRLRERQKDFRASALACLRARNMQEFSLTSGMQRRTPWRADR